MDLWIRDVEKINFDNDLSKKIENLVFVKLIMWDNKVYYWQDESWKEIDFIVQNNEQFDKYQVVLNLTIENQQRELWNFVLWSKYIDWNNFIITLDSDVEVIDYKNIKINKVNIINFLLDLY